MQTTLSPFVGEASPKREPDRRSRFAAHVVMYVFAAEDEDGREGKEET